MKFNIGDHLQEINTLHHGEVTDLKGGWYIIENDELGLVNHWVPEYNLELHKQTLRDNVLNELGI